MITHLTTRSTFREYADALSSLTPFKTRGSLEGQYVPVWRFGRLDYDYRDSFKQADYAVFSYSTPIAWHIPDVGWVMPDVHYSQTTTRHQGKIRTALSVIGAL